MKPAIAGTIFFIIWLGVMIIWSEIKDTKPDLSNLRALEDNSSGQFGHPLWDE